MRLAQQVSFAGYHQKVAITNPGVLAKKLHSRLVTKGDIFSFREKDRRIDLVVVNHTHQGEVVKIHKKTAIYIQRNIYSFIAGDPELVGDGKDASFTVQGLIPNKYYDNIYN